MTRIIRILGIALLVGTLAVPVFVWADGWGRGHHMMGPWGSGPEYDRQYERGYGNLTEEQRTQLEQLDRKFYDETADLRNEIWTNSAQLNTLLNNSNPDSEKVRALQKELSNLQAKLDEKRLNYELEARKITPEPRFGRGYGRGNYGRHMGGYGPGSCRN
jgi:zinc resistance-associated protein